MLFRSITVRAILSFSSSFPLSDRPVCGNGRPAHMADEFQNSSQDASVIFLIKIECRFCSGKSFPNNGNSAPVLEILTTHSAIVAHFYL